jgi:hypothetical protein
MKARQLAELLLRHPDALVGSGLGYNKPKVYVSSDRKHIMIYSGKNHDVVKNLMFEEVKNDTST